MTTEGYLVSAIVSTYNAERFIGGCLEDLLAQTIADRLEIIVVDSGSRQREGDIVRAFQKRHDNIRYLRTERRESLYGAWNRALAVARGRYVTSANTDDRHHPQALARMAEALDGHPEAALVYADLYKTGELPEAAADCRITGRLRWYDWDRMLLLERGCFIGPQPMWRRQVHDVFGGFDAGFTCAGDYEFWLRISQLFEFVHLPEPLGYYLERTDSVEHACGAVKDRETLRVQAEYLQAAAAGRLLRCRLADFEPLTPGAAGAPGRLAGAFAALEQLMSAGGDAGIAEHDQYRELKRRLLSGEAAADAAGDLERFLLARRPWYRRFQSRHFPQPTGGKTMASPADIYQAIQPLLQKAAADDARQALANLVALFPDFAQGHSDLGALYQRCGQPEKAQRHYARAAELAPGDTALLKHLAHFTYAELGQVEEALALYERVLAQAPDDLETLLLCGHIQVSRQEFEAAAGFYGRVLQVDPQHPQAAEYLDKIKAHLKASRPADPDALYREAQQLAGAGDAQAAIGRLREIVDEHPEHALAQNDLGVLLYQAGDKQAALACYEAAWRLQPENLTFAKNLAEFYYVEQGRVEEALRVCVEILRRLPEDIDTLLMTGHICASLGRADDARTFYQRVLEIEPWHQGAAEALERLSEAGPQRAEDTPAAAADGSDTESAERMYARACGLVQEGRGEEAVAVLEHLVRRRPDFALAHNDLGVLHQQAGRSEAALGCYEKAVSLEPENLTFKKNLADHYWVEAGRLQEALELYVNVLERAPEDIETLLGLGNVCMALERFDDARTFFERVLDIEPWNAEAGEKIVELDELGGIAQAG